jgi:hypothetical protein
VIASPDTRQGWGWVVVSALWMLPPGCGAHHNTVKQPPPWVLAGRCRHVLGAWVPPLFRPPPELLQATQHPYGRHGHLV